MPDPFAWNTEQGLHPEALDTNNTCKRKKRLIECNRYSTYEDGTGRLSAYVIIVLLHDKATKHRGFTHGGYHSDPDDGSLSNLY